MKTNLPMIATLLAIVTTLGTPGNSAQAQTTSPNRAEKQLARLIVNHALQQRGEMTMDPILHRVARQKAIDMAHRAYFSHTTPEGVGPNLAVRRAGYRLPAGFSGSRGANNLESIAAGYTDARAAFSGWLKSPAHRRHVLGTDPFYRSHTRFGVGSVELPGSPYQRYYVFLSAPAPANGKSSNKAASAAGNRVVTAGCGIR